MPFLALHLLSPMPLNYLLTSDDTVNVPHLCKDTIWTKMQEKHVKVLDKELRYRVFRRQDNRVYVN